MVTYSVSFSYLVAVLEYSQLTPDRRCTRATSGSSATLPSKEPDPAVVVYTLPVSVSTQAETDFRSAPGQQLM